MNHILLSELEAGGFPENGRVTHVDVDVESFIPPKGLKAIGFLFKGEKGDLNELLLDVLIAYTIASLDVTLEVPADIEDIDLAYLLSVANNVGFNVSFLPPQAAGDDAFAAYVDRVVECAKCYLSQPNMPRYIYPVSNFMEYLFIEAWTGAGKVTPTDEYVVQNFLGALPQEQEDTLKAAMREVIYRHYGGELGFLIFAKGTLKSIAKETVNIAHDLVMQRSAGAPQDPPQPGA